MLATHLIAGSFVFVTVNVEVRTLMHYIHSFIHEENGLHIFTGEAGFSASVQGGRSCFSFRSKRGASARWFPPLMLVYRSRTPDGGGPVFAWVCR